MTLTKDQVLKIATLAKLRLSEEEVEKYTTEISSILEYFDLLAEVEVEDVEITAQVTGLVNVHVQDNPEMKHQVFKEGIEKACLKTSNQPVELQQIKVPKVLE